MYARPTEPQSIGGVLDDGLKLWRDSIPKTWPLAVIAQLIVILPLLFLAYKFPSLKQAGQIPMSAASSAANVQALLAIFTSPTTWLTYLFILILSAVCYGAIILRIAAVADAAVLSLRGSVSAAMRLLPRMVAQALLFLLVIVAAMIVVVIVAGSGAGAGAGRALASLFGIALFFVFLFVFGRVFFASVILIVDNAGPAKSIGISWRLTRGYWWRCAVLLTVVFIIALVFSLVANLLTVWVSAALGPGSLIGTVLGQGLRVLVSAVLGSLFPAVLIAIVYDLKLRKQGGDLMSRVDSLAPQ